MLTAALDRFLEKVGSELVAKASPSESDEDTTHRIADMAVPLMVAAWLRAVAALQGGIVLAQVQRALNRGDLVAAEAAIPWEQAAITLGTVITEQVRDVVEHTAKASIQRLPPRVGLALRFDLLNPRAVEWVRSHSAELVRQVSDETKIAIRRVIERAFLEEMPPEEAARHIRSLVGLTERQATAVDNLRRRLIEEGRSPKRVQAMTETYTRRLIRERARNIARTEMIRASSAGQQEVWRQAADQGLIDPTTARREWIVTPDDRLCPVCAPLDGKTVGLDEEFAPGVLHPPLHPSCRCATALKF